MPAAAMRPGRFITASADRCQNPSSVVADDRAVFRRRPIRKELIRVPRSARTAGSTTTDERAAIAATAIPANAKLRRKAWRKTSSADNEIATVAAENTTVRPAVRMERTSASATGQPASSSSRYLETMNNA